MRDHATRQQRRLQLSVGLSVLIHVLAVSALAGMASGSIVQATPQVLSVAFLPSEQATRQERVQPATPAQAHLPVQQTPARVRAPAPPVISVASVSPLAVTDVPESSPSAPATPTQETQVDDQVLEADTAPDSAESGPSAETQFNVASLTNPAPEYPPESRSDREEGRVALRVQVSADGMPVDIQLLHSSGYPRLDQASIEAMRRWRFQPGLQNGLAVAAWVIVPFNFTLRK